MTNECDEVNNASSAAVEFLDHHLHEDKPVPFESFENKAGFFAKIHRRSREEIPADNDSDDNGRDTHREQ